MTRDEMFENFWKAYPPTNKSKPEKKDARHIWKVDECWKKYKQIMVAIKAQVKFRNSQRAAGVFQSEFPYAWRWLKKEKWNDETAVAEEKRVNMCDWDGCGNVAAVFKDRGRRCGLHPFYKFEVKK